ncbi:rRNA maturation RNase YbeY [Benzoatithermus flavus]|uniref:Endoribonuclease YbeY n=1 Tax=Benzoatithermus flavus TaxID=3108223 RepID=A0ABU8XX70_9PROT
MDNDSSHTIEVAVEAEAWHTAVTDPEGLCRRVIAAVLAEEAVPAGGEVSVLLTGDAAIRELNRTYRGKDAPTNVLSFPTGNDVAPDPGLSALLGDIAVALETTRREAEAEGKPLSDHLAHLLVHGTLHLLGYDHEEDDEARRMEAREVAILARLGIADPYRTEAVA